MNITKNGIPVHRKHDNPGKNYATLHRIEELTPVWLVIPFKWKEIVQLKTEGWRVIEVWESDGKGEIQ